MDPSQYRVTGGQSPTSWKCDQHFMKKHVSQKDGQIIPTPRGSILHPSRPSQMPYKVKIDFGADPNRSGFVYGIPISCCWRRLFSCQIIAHPQLCHSNIINALLWTLTAGALTWPSGRIIEDPSNICCLGV